MPQKVENYYQLNMFEAKLTITSKRMERDGFPVVITLPIEVLAKVLPFKWYWNGFQGSAQAQQVIGWGSRTVKQLHNLVVETYYNIPEVRKVHFVNPHCRTDLRPGNLFFNDKFSYEAMVAGVDLEKARLLRQAQEGLDAFGNWRREKNSVETDTGN